MAKKPTDYEVGYRKPPGHTRFKKGQSGNPKGRRKGTQNLATDLAEELGERIRVREGDRELSVSKQRAMVKTLVSRALKGDPRSISVLIGLAAKNIASPDGSEQKVQEASRAEKEIIETLLERYVVARAKKSKD